MCGASNSSNGSLSFSRADPEQRLTSSRPTSAHEADFKLIARTLASGPIFENVLAMASRPYAFSSALVHELDGGRYIGTRISS